MAHDTAAHDAVVVGGGPTGLFAVGTLLDLGAQRLLWVDAAAVDGAGRLTTYAAVPSNTKTRLFVRGALECASFRAVWDHLAATGRGHSLAQLQALPSDSECPLGLAATMLAELAAGVIEHYRDRIETRVGRVTRIEGAGPAAWTIVYAVEPEGTLARATAPVVIVATGSYPLQPAGASAPHAVARAGGVPVIPLDDALDPQRLAQALATLPGSGPVAVLGSSHSAVLVLKNLAEAAAAPPIVNFYRSPFLFAEYLDETTILNDNTGLKGVAAAWTRRHLADACPEPLPTIRRVLTTPETEPAAYTTDLARCRAVVYAVGYGRNPLPAVVVDGRAAAAVDYDADGHLTADGHVCVGLYGFGIAFPERTRTSEGAPDLSVGLWKFMRHIRRALTDTAPARLSPRAS